MKKVVLKNFAIFTGKHLCWTLFLIELKARRSATLLKETPTQVFSVNILKFIKNTYFEEHMRNTASNSFNSSAHASTTLQYWMYENLVIYIDIWKVMVSILYWDLL